MYLRKSLPVLFGQAISMMSCHSQIISDNIVMNIEIKLATVSEQVTKGERVEIVRLLEGSVIQEGKANILLKVVSVKRKEMTISVDGSFFPTRS